MQVGKPRWLGGMDDVERPYVIAEVGVNHNGILEAALRLVEAARAAGADCVKFQAFSADELAVKGAAKAEYQERCGAAGEGQDEMLRRYELRAEAFGVIGEHCSAVGIDFLVTPFSPRWVGELTALGARGFKIGSGNLTMVRLLRAIGATRLPVIISTGMADLEAVAGALAVLRGSGSGAWVLLHCVSLYPTRLDQVNLRAMAALRAQFGGPVGFSDHTVEVVTGGLAVAAGATVLEKHFTLDKGQEGPDHGMSLTPGELAEYVELARQAGRALGDGVKAPGAEELAMKAMVGVSVVAARRIAAGSVIGAEMVAEKRAGSNVPCAQMDRVLGKGARVDIEADTLLTLDLIKANPGAHGGEEGRDHR